MEALCKPAGEIRQKTPRAPGTDPSFPLQSLWDDLLRGGSNQEPGGFGAQGLSKRFISQGQSPGPVDYLFI